MTTFSRLFLVLLAISLGWFSFSVSASELATSDYFGNAEVMNLKLSPDGRYAAFTFEDETEVKLGVLDIEKSRLVSSFGHGTNRQVMDFWWANNERVVMAVGIVTGYLDHTGRPSHLFAANVDGSRREQIVDGTRAAFQVIHTLPEDPNRILIIRYNYREGGDPQPYWLNVYNGQSRPQGTRPMDHNLQYMIADNNGEVRVMIAYVPGETLDDGDLTLYVLKGEEWSALDLDAQRPSPDLGILGFSADNRIAYFLSDHDQPPSEAGRRGVFSYNLDSGRMELLFRDELVNVDRGIYGHDGEVLGVTLRNGPTSYIFFEDMVETSDDAILLQRLIASFPGQDVTIPSWSRDGGLAIVHVRGDRNPGEFYLFDTDTMQARFLSATMPALTAGQLVPMETLQITARDGLELEAYLTRPADSDGPVPLIVNVHGGPFGVADYWGFNNEAQFFARHGFATLQVNFRGSGNRGMDFQREGYRQWGQKMQDDVTDATTWAIDEGIANAGQICIYGGSYGGYAALMGVVREPDLYACAVGFVGVYDLPWFRAGDGNDVSSRRGRDGRAGFNRFMSTTVGDDVAMLQAGSPVHQVNRIKAELFLIHGGSDQRVVVGHAHRLRAALDEAGKDYEWLLKEEEGHGFYDIDNRVEMYDRMVRFFNRHIGQPPATDQVSASGQD